MRCPVVKMYTILIAVQNQKLKYYKQWQTHPEELLGVGVGGLSAFCIRARV